MACIMWLFEQPHTILSGHTSAGKCSSLLHVCACAAGGQELQACLHDGITVSHTVAGTGTCKPRLCTPAYPTAACVRGGLPLPPPLARGSATRSTSALTPACDSSHSHTRCAWLSLRGPGRGACVFVSSTVLFEQPSLQRHACMRAAACKAGCWR